MTLDLLRGRQNAVPLTNKSGGGVIEGDVVIVDDGNASAFTTTATEGYTADLIGVVLETIANDAVGRVCFGGYVAQINLDGAAAIGDFIKTDGVAKQGTPVAAIDDEGIFAEALTASATPPAIIFNQPSQAGGGDSTFTAVYGSRPAASNDGDLFLPSDGYYLERDTGAAWVPWGPIFPFTAPVSGDFAWVNQGGAAVDATKGGVLLSVPASATDNIRIRKKAAPGTPYTIDIALLINFSATNYISAGFVWRQSSDGKLVIVGMQFNTAITGYWHFLSQKWTNPTTFSASYFTGNIPYLYAPMIFIRVEDDATDRNIYYSADNQNWELVHTVGRTDFITADEVGFYCAVTHATLTGSMLLLNWVEG